MTARLAVNALEPLTVSTLNPHGIHIKISWAPKELRRHGEGKEEAASQRHTRRIFNNEKGAMMP